MKSQKILLVSLMICMAGCVPSLHQLWTDKTLVYDPHFVGTFAQEDGLWQIEGDAEKKAYQITIKEDDDPESVLVAHLVVLVL